MKKNFGLEQKVNGMSMLESMANLIERNEHNEIELNRAKLTISAYKQMNNYSRLCLDAAKYELKYKQFEVENNKDNK